MNRKIWCIVVLGTLLLPAMAMNGISNNPPDKPTINGPTSGEAGKEYTYTVVSTDPDGDKIMYCINWGDGNEMCTDYVKSGQQVEFHHTWSEKGTYTVTVTATDEHGAESEPATLQVKMPYAKPLFEKFKIIKPRNGLYIYGIKVMPLPGQIVIGDINVRVRAPSYIKRVEFYLLLTCGCGLAKMHVDTEPPFEWKWHIINNPEIKEYGMTWIFAKGYDSQNREVEDNILVYRT